MCVSLTSVEDRVSKDQPKLLGENLVNIPKEERKPEVVGDKAYFGDVLYQTPTKTTHTCIYIYMGMSLNEVPCLPKSYPKIKGNFCIKKGP